VAKTAGGEDASMSYEDAWGTILCKCTPFRCRLCPDSTGELADLSCGDPWYRTIEPNDPGRSLVLVRTPAGRKALHDAMRAGYLQIAQVDPASLPRSQQSLLERRRHLWGRLLALRLLGAPTPRFRGFALFANWRSLSVADKMRSVLGTIRRARRRGWSKPCPPAFRDGV
jgi:coenzyme F420 hydrogenase subunit beta